MLGKTQIQNMQSIHTSECLMAGYVDLSKEFDNIDHNILLTQLQHFWVTGRVFDWFRTYLTDRKQYVAADAMYLIMKITESGIPKGLNLLPLLTLL